MKNNEMELDALREVMESVIDYMEVGNTPENIDLPYAIHVKKDIIIDQAGETVKKGMYLSDYEMKVFQMQKVEGVTAPKPFDVFKVVKPVPLMYKGEQCLIANLVWAIYAYMDTSERVQKAIEGYMDLTKDNDFVYPSSPILHFLNQALNAFGKGRNITVNRNTVFTQEHIAGDQWKIKSKNNKNELAITIDNVTALQRNNKGLKKLFAFIIIKGNEQGFSPEVSFPLQDLVDCGMYSTPSNARRGFKDNITKIMSLTIEGTTKRGKKDLRQEGGKLIYHYSIANNEVSISFNPKLNISFIAQYFSLLPDFAFSLSNNAFTLLEYIFYLARQNTKAIKEKGTFNIGLRAVRDYLQLPHESETQKHSQYIKEPLENAIEEIENHIHAPGLTITPIYNESGNIKEWLKGYLEIGLSGKYADAFTSIAAATEKKLEERKRRADKAMIAAQVKAIESKAKAENQ